MSFRTSTRHPLLVGAAAVALLAACDTDRATVLEPFGTPARTFPVSAVAAASASLPGGALSVTRGAAAAGGLGTVRATLRHLEPLTGGVYKVWLGEETGTTSSNFVPAVGTLRVITGPAADRDTVLTENVSSFNGVADTTARYELTVNSTTMGGDPTTAARNVVLVTIETSDAATAPTTTGPRPLWARFTRPAEGASTTATFNFGNYDADVTKQFVFTPAGRGTALVRDNFLAIDDTMLARPPRGYYYVAYLIGQDEEGVVTDTIELGELTAPFPRGGVSLRDADQSIVDQVVTERPYALSAVSVRYMGATDMRFVGYPTVVIALKNKLAANDTAPPNTVLIGAIPDEIAFPEDEE